jgi:hypothetical protein
MNTDKQPPHLQRGSNTAYLLKQETHDVERGQMLNYLRIAKLRVGLILNFKHARLEGERAVL